MGRGSYHTHGFGVRCRVKRLQHLGPRMAKRELLDCVAVLMREWERISQ